MQVELYCNCKVLTPFGRRHPMHIWLIPVSSSNLDSTVASYRLSRRIHRTAAAGALFLDYQSRLFT